MFKDEAFEMMKTIVALDLGIIPVNLSVKESLQKMEPDEARKSRRKFRKIKRKLLPFAENGRVGAHTAKLAVKRHVYDLARESLLQGK